MFSYIFRTKTVLSISLSLALIFASSFASAQGTITTIAGSGRTGPGTGSFGGDGGLATQALLSEPEGVAVDSAGNLYISDTRNHRVRKVDLSGIINTVAGTGIASFGGDGGPAVLAQLNIPSGIALDLSGNLYIADGANHRVRKVNPSGIITTVVGTGQPGFSGDGGPATLAQLVFPTDLALDSSGNLYISENGNNRVRKVDNQGIITTFAGRFTQSIAGDGSLATLAQFATPRGLAVDGANNLYIVDFFNNRVRKVDSNGIINTVAGSGPTGPGTGGFGGDGGPATQALLDAPTGVAVDSSGSLYIADRGNDRIRKVDPSGIITTVAGTGVFGFGGDGGPAAQAQLSFPTGVALDISGNLYIADTDNNRIRKVAFVVTPTTGTISGLITNSSTGAPISGALVSTITGGFSTTSGANGSYTLSNVAAGTYTVNVSVSGYLSASQSGVNVTAGQTTTLNQSLTPLPAISLSPTSLSFSAQQGGSNPANQTFTVRNSGGGTLNYIISDDTTWLAVSPASGTATTETDTISVSVDISGLSAGTLTGIITVADPNAANSPQTLQLTLTLSPSRPPQVTEVRIGPATVNLTAIGQTLQLAATAVFSDGTTREVTNEASWGSLNPAVATVTGTGFLTAVSAGNTGVSATYQGIIGSATVNVSPPRVIEVRISPPSSSFTTIGQTQQLRATATFSDGATRDVTNEASWQSLNPGVAAVTGTGFVTAASAGQATIQATFLGVTGMATVTVRPPQVTEIRISPPTATFTAAGQTTQLRASAAFSDGTTRDVTNEASWQSLNPAVASVTGTGFLTAVSAGETTVLVTVQGVIGRATISVRPPQVVEVRVSPPRSTLSAIGQTAQLGATAIFIDGTARDVTGEATWQSLNPAVATVTGTGFITAISEGITSVSATFQGIAGSASINVSPPQVIEVRVSPPVASFTIAGQTQQLRATATFSDGATRDVTNEANWQSQNPAVATVTNTGFVTAISAGQTTVQALFGDLTGRARIDFRPVTVSLSPSNVNVPVGGSVRLSAATSDGSDTGYFFSSDNPSAAAVSSEGVVTGLSEGAATITATGIESGASAAATVTITPPAEIAVAGTIRIRPQLLAAGFDPTLVDLTDDSFDIIAFVRPSALAISAVTITQNQGSFRFGMNLTGVLPNGDQLWRATFNFPRGSISNTVLRALWGDRPGEFNVTVIDEAQGRHSFPDLEFGNNPALRETMTSPNLIDRSPGTRRARPQLLAAGFSPTLIDLSDDRFDIIAVVRQGAVPIRTVTITQNQGQFAISMNSERALDNGDQLWRATFNFDRGTISSTILRALWGDRPGEFNVTAIDEAQQRHSFPDLEFGNNPAIN